MKPALSGWQSSNIIREALHVEGKGSWCDPNRDLVVELKLTPSRTLPLPVCPLISPYSSMRGSLRGLCCLLLQRQTMHRI